MASGVELTRTGERDESELPAWTRMRGAIGFARVDESKVEAVEG